MRRLARWLPNLYLFLVLLILYVPVLVVVAFSFNQSENGVLWTGFTTEWYGKLMNNRQILNSFRNSLVVALWSCLIAAVVGTLGAVGLARSRFRSSALLESVNALPIMLPEIVLGMAFLAFFSMIGLPFGMVTLILAHATFCIPYVLIIVKSRLAGLDPAYEEAARDLGANAAQAFFTIVMPLVMPAVASGVLLAFAMSLDDMIISFFVTGPESTTFPVYVFGKLKTDVPPSINAMCTLVLGTTFLAVALSGWLRARQRD